MSTLKLPIGIDSFAKLRTQGFYYVDKTPLIKELLEQWAEVNLFTRPRRFGKSLNMSMLCEYFEIGGDKALFDGLAIENEKALNEKYMGAFPVVFVSLKSVDGLSFQAACDMLSDTIYTEALRHQHLMNSDKLSVYEKLPLKAILTRSATLSDIKNSLRTLTRLLSKHYGKQAILLIDEYDMPLDRAYTHGYYNEMLDVIRAMFGIALKSNPGLYFAVLTGCLRVSKESLFTGLNNLKVYSILDEHYNEYFGFTRAEVERMLEFYGKSAHMAQAREWYDGYLFGGEHVYCPWDVINYCHDLMNTTNAQPQAYWLNTSGNDIVRRLIDRAQADAVQADIEKLISGGAINKTLNLQLTHNEIELNIQNIWSLLSMTGYLTVTGKPANNSYELVIPNREVRQIYIDQVRAWFTDKARSENALLGKLFGAFEAGDAIAIETALNEQLLYAISFHDAYESFYHGFMLALLSACADWRVVSNAETGKGRSDIKAERKDLKRGFIVEVKDVKRMDKLDAACQSAIAQIEARDYTAQMRKYRIPEIWMYGIAFCDEECRVLAKRA